MSRSRIGTAPVESAAAENNDTAGRHQRRDTGVIALVANLVIAARFDLVIVEVIRSHAYRRIGQYRHRPVLYRHIVQRAPAGEIGPVVMTDIAGVLVPAELRAHLGKFDHILFMETEKAFSPKRCPTYVGH